MEYEIKNRPAYPMLVVSLGAGEKITAEAGALVYMTPNVQLETRMRSGILRSLKVSVLGGQSFFVNDYFVKNGLGEIGFVAAPTGDIEVFELMGNGYVLQSSAYIASTSGIALDTEWQGFKGIFAQGLFMVKAAGSGKLFINVFGAIEKKVLKAGEHLIVDNFHLVAFSDTCRYSIKKVGGLKSTILSGEGLVVDIEGPGEVHLQTKSVRELVAWLWTLLEPRVSTMLSSRAR